MKQIISVVLTGGPCAGKSNSIIELKEFLSDLGYKVIIIPEIATKIRSDGFIGNIEKIAFQNMIFKMQLFNEDLYRDMILKMNDNSNVILILDRGLMDNKIYLSEEEFDKLKFQNELTDEKIFKRYTAVFHLESTAVGNAEFYDNFSNEYRLADYEYARKLENRGIEVWNSHPNFHMINVEENFEIKLEKLKKAILDLLNVYK